MKKMLAVLVAVMMLCGIAGVGAGAVDEDPRLAELQAIVEEYNATHGGTGALEVEEQDPICVDPVDFPGYCANQYVITGEVRGATKGIAFPEHLSVDWRATLMGETNGEPMLKSPYYSVISGEIRTNGLAIEGRYVYLGATIVGDVRAYSLTMISWTITGAIYCDESVSLWGNTVADLTALSAKRLYLFNNVQLHLAGPIKAPKETYIAPGVTITGERAGAFIRGAKVARNAPWLEWWEEIPIVQFILRWIYFWPALLGM